MCFILFAYDIHPIYRLILAANRDEFYGRPSKPLDIWPDHPDIIGGRDLKEMGTWMGISRSGRLAAITNYREPQINAGEKKSRGLLVGNFLKSQMSAQTYLTQVQDDRSSYNGFNLLVGTIDDLWYYSNRDQQILKLPPGLHGLSNHLLNTPWPKVIQGKKRFRDLLNNQAEISNEEVFQILADQSHPDDAQLPNTGIGLEWERILSPIFVTSPAYGTRCSSVIMVDKFGGVRIYERTYLPESNTHRIHSDRYTLSHFEIVTS